MTKKNHSQTKDTTDICSRLLNFSCGFKSLPYIFLKKLDPRITNRLSFPNSAGVGPPDLVWITTTTNTTTTCRLPLHLLPLLLLLLLILIIKIFI